LFVVREVSDKISLLGEIEHSLKLSQPKFVFVSAHAASATIEICRNLRFVQKVVLLDGQPPKGDKLVITLSELIAAHATTRFNVEDHSTQKIDTVDQTAMILCSSGTTGMPKGVLITQANLISCLQSFKELVGLMKNNIGPLISLHFAPWFHVLGFMNMFFCACLHDALFVFLPKFDEKIFLKSIEKYKATVTSVVPPIMVLLAKSPLVDNYDLSSLRIVSCGAAALSSETEDLVRKRLGENVMLRQGYGMSEGTFSLIAAGLDGKPGSVGVVVPDVYVKVIDENGKTLGANQRGELCFKGRRIMKGYINDPKATSETIDSDGWLHSGDVGFYDEDKQFFVVDRLKELIKYNGFQVPPAELEGLLLTHPKVKDVGVIGIPDEEVGERAMAFIVAQPGVQLAAKEVIDLLKMSPTQSVCMAASSSSKKFRKVRLERYSGVSFVHSTSPHNQSFKLLTSSIKGREGISFLQQLQKHSIKLFSSAGSQLSDQQKQETFMLSRQRHHKKYEKRP